MAEVKVDLTGQVAQFDVTLMFTGDEAVSMAVIGIINIIQRGVSLGKDGSSGGQ